MCSWPVAPAASGSRQMFLSGQGGFWIGVAWRSAEGGSERGEGNAVLLHGI